MCIITIGEQIVARVWWKSISVYPNLYEKAMQARIRAMISAAHTSEDLDFALDAFECVSKEPKVLRSEVNQPGNHRLALGKIDYEGATG